MATFKNGFGHEKPSKIGLFWASAHFAHLFFNLMRRKKLILYKGYENGRAKWPQIEIDIFTKENGGRVKYILFYEGEREEKAKKAFLLYLCFMRESDFQSKLIKEIKQRFQGCFVIKTDAGYLQGFPDLLILYKDKWAALECKKNKGASHRPNQDYYIDILSKLSFSKFIYPENKEEVLNELQRSFESSRPTRVSRSE